MEMVGLSYNFCNAELANQQLFVLQMAVEGQEAVILTITLSSGLYHELSLFFLYGVKNNCWCRCDKE